VAFRGEEDLARFAIDGRHLPLDEEADVFEAELPVLGEEACGGLMVLRARHDVEGGRLAVPPADRHDLLGMNLEEAGGGDRPDRVGPLGTVEAEARAEPPRDDHDGDLAGRQGRRADRRGVPPRDAFAIRPGEAGHVYRPHPFRRGHVGTLGADQGRDQRVEPLEVDPLDLGDQSGPLVPIELVPPREQVPLSMPGQARDQRRVRRHSHPLLS